MEYRYTNTDDLQTMISISVTDLEILQKVLAAVGRQNVDWLKKQNLSDYPYSIERLEREIEECKISTYEGAMNYIMQKQNDPKVEYKDA